MPKFLSVKEVAERLGIMPQSVREAIHAGTLPATRVGNSWIIEESIAAAYEPRTYRDRQGSKPKGRPPALEAMTGA